VETLDLHSLPMERSSCNISLSSGREPYGDRYRTCQSSYRCYEPAWTSSTKNPPIQHARTIS